MHIHEGVMFDQITKANTNKVLFHYRNTGFTGLNGNLSDRVHDDKLDWSVQILIVLNWVAARSNQSTFNTVSVHLWLSRVIYYTHRTITIHWAIEFLIKKEKTCWYWIGTIGQYLQFRYWSQYWQRKSWIRAFQSDIHGFWHCLVALVFFFICLKDVIHLIHLVIYNSLAKDALKNRKGAQFNTSHTEGART